MKRFGKSYGTHAEQYEPIVATPVGKRCMYFRCKELIEEDDDGFIGPAIRTNANGTQENIDYIVHRDCYLFSIGAIAHECKLLRSEAHECDFKWKHDKKRDPFARHV